MEKLESITIIPLKSLPKQAYLNDKPTRLTFSQQEVEALKNYNKKVSMDNDSEIIDEPHSKSR